MKRFSRQKRVPHNTSPVRVFSSEIFVMQQNLRIQAAVFILLAAAVFTACSHSSSKKSTPAMPAQPANPPSASFYNFTVNSLEGQPVSLDRYRGKKIIVLNTASECGYTPQYADWQKFYAENQNEVVVLGFPCNDFGGQEPGSATEIKGFCQKNYGVTFPMFEKVAVKGAGKAPVYQWLTDPAKNGWNSQEPSWNFCKYVIDENGRLTHFFDSKVKPNSEVFMKAMGM